MSIIAKGNNKNQWPREVSMIGGCKCPILFHQEPNLCLINQELAVVKQVSWPYSIIRDMC